MTFVLEPTAHGHTGGVRYLSPPATPESAVPLDEGDAFRAMEAVWQPVSRMPRVAAEMGVMRALGALMTYDAHFSGRWSILAGVRYPFAPHPDAAGTPEAVVRRCLGVRLLLRACRAVHPIVACERRGALLLATEAELDGLVRGALRGVVVRERASLWAATALALTADFPELSAPLVATEDPARFYAACATYFNSPWGNLRLVAHCRVRSDPWGVFTEAVLAPMRATHWGHLFEMRAQAWGAVVRFSVQFSRVLQHATFGTHFFFAVPAATLTGAASRDPAELVLQAEDIVIHLDMVTNAMGYLGCWLDDPAVVEAATRQLASIALRAVHIAYAACGACDRVAWLTTASARNRFVAGNPMFIRTTPAPTPAPPHLVARLDRLFGSRKLTRTWPPPPPPAHPPPPSPPSWPPAPGASRCGSATAGGR